VKIHYIDDPGYRTAVAEVDSDAVPTVGQFVKVDGKRRRVEDVEFELEFVRGRQATQSATVLLSR